MKNKIRNIQSTSQSQMAAAAAVNSQKLKSTTVHIMALDGIVNVNSLFTLAVFLGLTINPSDPTYTLISTTTTATNCVAGSSVAKNLVTSHVYSFSSFLFSSLIACGLKQAIRSAKEGDTRVEVGNDTIAHVNLKVLRAGIMSSAIGSVFGCVFLTMALVDLVQIKLGMLSCGSWYSIAAVSPLAILVPSALVIYVCIMLHAFTR